MGGNTLGKNPTDRGKLGTNRSVLTDGGGVPIGLAVEGANRHDLQRGQETLPSRPLERPTPTPEKPQGRCLDKGADVDDVRELLTKVEFTAHLRARGEAAQALKRAAGDKARRWVVESSHL